MHMQRQSFRPCMQGPVDNHAGEDGCRVVDKDGKIPYMVYGIIEKGFKYVPVYASHIYNICALIAINI